MPQAIYYTVREISDMLGTSERFIRREIHRGHLKASAFHHGRVHQGVLDDWLSDRAEVILKATEFIGSDHARLVQLELFGLPPEQR